MTLFLAMGGTDKNGDGKGVASDCDELSRITPLNECDPCGPFERGIEN
jgi:hypothetical protein